jgi:NADPH:quinone reductase
MFMKAIRIHAFGPPDSLVYEEISDPVAGSMEVVVRVEASGVNPADYKFRNGLLARVIKQPLPFTPGMDIVGHIISVGPGVTNHRVGDRVIAMLYMMGNGGYAERVAVPEEWCATIPTGLDAVKAAALPTPATTAVELIEDDLRVATGQKILVTGATGAVGMIACYVAKQRGAHVTAAVRQKYAADVRHADDVLVLGGDIEPFRQRFDLIADTIGGEIARGLLPTLKPGGVLTSVSTDRFQNTEGLDVVIRNFGNRPDARRLGLLALAASTGDLQLPPIKTMKLSEASKAHQQIESAGSGKIVLVPDAT